MSFPTEGPSPKRRRKSTIHDLSNAYDDVPSPYQSPSNQFTRSPSITTAATYPGRSMVGASAVGNSSAPISQHHPYHHHLHQQQQRPALTPTSTAASSSSFQTFSASPELASPQKRALGIPPTPTQPTRPPPPSRDASQTYRPIQPYIQPNMNGQRPHSGYPNAPEASSSSSSSILPPLSLSILGVEPLDEFIKEVADFVHHMITTRAAEYEHLGGVVEVEAKVGLLKERNGQRLALPVLVESSESVCSFCLNMATYVNVVLTPDAIDARFESNMTVVRLLSSKS